MLLVAGSGTDKAEATKIVSNLRSIKAAALMYYADNPGTTPTAGPAQDVFKKYMDKEMPDEYVVLVASGDAVWFVGMGGANKITAGVSEKLVAVAKDSGLYGSTGTAAEPTASGDSYVEYKLNDNSVWMRAR